MILNSTMVVILTMSYTGIVLLLQTLREMIILPLQTPGLERLLTSHLAPLMPLLVNSKLQLLINKISQDQVSGAGSPTTRKQVILKSEKQIITDYSPTNLMIWFLSCQPLLRQKNGGLDL